MPTNNKRFGLSLNRIGVSFSVNNAGNNLIQGNYGVAMGGCTKWKLNDLPFSAGDTTKTEAVNWVLENF